MISGLGRWGENTKREEGGGECGGFKGEGGEAQGQTRGRKGRRRRRRRTTRQGTMCTERLQKEVGIRISNSA
jgi:hypothetical protein